MRKTILFGILVLILFTSGCGQEITEQECQTDLDCQSYCGDDECLMPVCIERDIDSPIKYCDCAGICGEVIPPEVTDQLNNKN